jgi:hypothetical protein
MDFEPVGEVVGPAGAADTAGPAEVVDTVVEYFELLPEAEHIACSFHNTIDHTVV